MYPYYGYHMHQSHNVKNIYDDLTDFLTVCIF